MAFPLSMQRKREGKPHSMMWMRRGGWGDTAAVEMLGGDVLCVKSFSPRELLAVGTVDAVILVHSSRPLLTPTWENRSASGCVSSQKSSHPGCYLLLSSLLLPSSQSLTHSRQPVHHPSGGERSSYRLCSSQDHRAAVRIWMSQQICL